MHNKKKVSLYLRKSRADEELERIYGEKETLSRHRTALLKYAKEKGLDVVAIHEELVSGDELFFRPKMLQMLKEIESGLYNGILIMDIQRLGRGDTEEQGLILKTLKKAGITIFTPNKIYDLSNEMDENYIEFEAFMGRQEYRMITRRMQGGRVRSIQEGNYISTRPPYGYLINDVDKKTRSLIPHPDQAPVIKMIFDWYVNKNMGCGKIADELNRLGIKSYTGQRWERTAITSFIKNPVYIGKLVWKKKCIRKSKITGKSKDTYTRPESEWIISDGKHEGIIDIELFNRAQEILKSKYHVPYQIENGIVNPLAGLIYCGICGEKMKRRPYTRQRAHLICDSKCGIKSNRFESVETAVIRTMNDFLKKMQISLEQGLKSEDNSKLELLTSTLYQLEKELNGLESQKMKAFDLLEQGVYDINTFTDRSRYLSEKIETVTKSIFECKSDLETEQQLNGSLEHNIIKLRNALDAYSNAETPEEKNLILKGCVDKITYYKEKTWKKDEFKLELSPRILMK